MGLQPAGTPRAQGASACRFPSQTGPSLSRNKGRGSPRGWLSDNRAHLDRVGLEVPPVPSGEEPLEHWSPWDILQPQVTVGQQEQLQGQTQLGCHQLTRCPSPLLEHRAAASPACQGQRPCTGPRAGLSAPVQG
ncbi:PREDICTED: uncharacterized protein LOC105593391 [Cercocebus atys]|uniref:uncharacterized protein LOC105593391 n=1 Tax=Cercocebus atys TaxID=9531 RepID=UPI0005F4639D|nr:PREDICTED: uncharacterized protein LOC105593391 [Cercocebus atys]